MFQNKALLKLNVDMEERDMKASIGWYFKQLLPMVYWSEYTVMKDAETEDHKEVQVFKMWLGKTLWVKRWTVI